MLVTGTAQHRHQIHTEQLIPIFFLPNRAKVWSFLSTANAANSRICPFTTCYAVAGAGKWSAGSS